MIFINEGAAGIAFWFKNTCDDNGEELIELEVYGEDNSFHTELDIDNPVHVLYKGIEAALSSEEHMEGLANLGTVAIMAEIDEVMTRAKERMDLENKPKKKIVKKKTKASNVVRPDFGKKK